MNSRLYTIPGNCLNSLETPLITNAHFSLESGQVIFFPELSFTLLPEEKNFYTDLRLDGKHKNISYDRRKDKLGGITKDSSNIVPLKAFMQRFSLFARDLVETTLPHYKNHLEWGRTSFRPAEIKGRRSSKRKDDTRLHVDSFPASPVNGKRILRVFSNINPYSEPRIWLLGEPFDKVIERFINTVPKYNRFYARILQTLKATKSFRSAYDHYMLNVHDNMKLDDHYQDTVTKDHIEFPAQSTWVVYTDYVSHAALSGRHLLEQTFYLEPEKMKHPEMSPLHRLASKTQQTIFV
ncbi:hypothetical protein Lade_0853 [Legionella adelaidensis]|uniref:3-deoxy-D-manno-oct-2-ulosonic acid (Kdo) hydroxylase n=1 Tax=Legionella adelaidensis TaxID=45056 RepID=A0A0W0R545_9GAMM|nr:Kdo hydroxylase family protein [Legionella adelaidensis]KTC66195.1 hypothetical protein Lade_0853 [Legionella adelaidensis]